jgi:hypothetical protein
MGKFESSHKKKANLFIYQRLNPRFDQQSRLISLIIIMMIFFYTFDKCHSISTP